MTGRIKLDFIVDHHFIQLGFFFPQMPCSDGNRYYFKNNAPRSLITGFVKKSQRYLWKRVSRCIPRSIKCTFWIYFVFLVSSRFRRDCHRQRFGGRKTGWSSEASFIIPPLGKVSNYDNRDDNYVVIMFSCQEAMSSFTILIYPFPLCHE